MMTTDRQPQNNICYRPVRTIMVSPLILTFILLSALLLPTLASSHSLFIQSGRYHVEKGKDNPLFFCFGHHFPVDEGVRRNKLNYVRVIAPDKDVTEIELRDEKSLHSYSITYEKPGSYALIAETNPGYFAMYTDKKGRNRHSLKPLHTFIDNAESVQASMRSSQWAKTYVDCAEPTGEFPAEVGLPLELIPEKNPASLSVGDSITFRVHFDGKPYQGEGHWDATYGGFSTESEDMFIQRTATSKGAFTVPIETSGRWFVRFFTKTDAPEEQKENYLTEKRTATLTFNVHNERKRPKISDH